MSNDTIGQPAKLKPKWRNSFQIRGTMSQLIYALSRPRGQYDRVQIDEKVAKNLLEICHQAIHTEVGHEPTAIEIEQARKDL
jgi:hypothetical protein